MFSRNLLSMTLLEALNRLNETDGSLVIEEKEIRDASITENGIDKQVVSYVLFRYKFLFRYFLIMPYL